MGTRLQLRQQLDETVDGIIAPVERSGINPANSLPVASSEG
jgi:hypothetical protein